MSGAGLTVLAVDDERPALEDLARLLRTSPLVARVETAADGPAALLLLAEVPVDVVFLDVRMPGLDGVELARVLQQFADPPSVVFVSAYESAAVDAFALRALDYLMKPVGRARVQEALERVVPVRRTGAGGSPGGRSAPGGGRSADGGERRVGTAGAAAGGSPGGAGGDGSVPVPDDDVVPVDTPRGTRLLRRQSILFLEAHGDYVRIHADDGRFLLRARLGDLQERWEPIGFVRVHRGYVVNLRRAVELRSRLDGTTVIVFPGDAEVPVSRRRVPELRRRLGT